jgi:translation initiation factor EIF-2B subunit related
MMTVQKGLVKYKDRTDLLCTYGTNESGVNYYFLSELANKNIIASSELIEAIDPEVIKSHVGLINSEGKELIPLINKNIKLINDDMLLVEISKPVSSNVVDASTNGSNVVADAAYIKEQMNTLSNNMNFLFHDHTGEATIYDSNGNNLLNNEYYSYIGLVENDGIYLSKNIPNSGILKLPLASDKVKEENIAEENKYQEENPFEKPSVNISNDDYHIPDAIEPSVSIPEVKEDNQEVNDNNQYPDTNQDKINFDNNDDNSDTDEATTSDITDTPMDINTDLDTSHSDFNIQDDNADTSINSNVEEEVNDNNVYDTNSNNVLGDATELVKKLTDLAKSLQEENKRLKEELLEKNEKIQKMEEANVEFKSVLDSAQDFLNNQNNA